MPSKRTTAHACALRMAKSTRMTCGELSRSIKKHMKSKWRTTDRYMFNSVMVCAGLMMRDAQLSLMECHADNKVHEVSFNGKKARFKLVKSIDKDLECMTADVVTEDGRGNGRHYPSNGPVALTASYRVDGFGVIELSLAKGWDAEEGDRLVIKTCAL